MGESSGNLLLLRFLENDFFSLKKAEKLNSSDFSTLELKEVFSFNSSFGKVFFNVAMKKIHKSEMIFSFVFKYLVEESLVLVLFKSKLRSLIEINLNLYMYLAMKITK